MPVSIWKGNSVKILIASTLALICFVCDVNGHGPNDRSKILISFKSHGDHCFSLCVGEGDLACCPVYSVTINGDGQVEYDGTMGVKVRGKKAHSVSAAQVAQLVENFYKIGFFSLSDSYDDHRFDHYNAFTIALTVGERKKSIYVAQGQPDELNVLMHKVIEVSGISKYLGRS